MSRTWFRSACWLVEWANRAGTVLWFRILSLLVMSLSGAMRVFTTVEDEPIIFLQEELIHDFTPRNRACLLKSLRRKLQPTANKHGRSRIDSNLSHSIDTWNISVIGSNNEAEIHLFQPSFAELGPPRVFNEGDQISPAIVPRNHFNKLRTEATGNVLNCQHPVASTPGTESLSPGSPINPNLKGDSLSQARIFPTRSESLHPVTLIGTRCSETIECVSANTASYPSIISTWQVENRSDD
jgi:hypothetical protein